MFSRPLYHLNKSLVRCLLSDAENQLEVSNDVIIEVNIKRTSNTKDYEAVVSRIKSGQNVLLLVFRNGSAIYISLSAK